MWTQIFMTISGKGWGWEQPGWQVSCIFAMLFVNTVFMIRLFAVIASLFMLPETAHMLLMLMVLAGGYFIAAGGLEVRARVGEILYGVVLYPLALMLLFAAFSINPGIWDPGRHPILSRH